MTEPTLRCRVVRVLALRFAARLRALSRAGSPPARRGAAGAVVCLLSGCVASAEMPMPAVSAGQDADAAAIATVESSPFLLVRQPAGEPLPPPNRAVAGNWPADVRRLIVAMVALFPDSPTRPFDVREIADTLHIRLEPQDVSPSRTGVERAYTIHGWALGRPEAEGRTSLSFMLPRHGKRFVFATFLIDTSRFCIDPYEFAVYTGANYSPAMPLHGFPPPYQPSGPQYQWGMFENRTPTGRYMASRGPAITTDGKCIGVFEAMSREPEVQQ
jgi:hypothetical protein